MDNFKEDAIKKMKTPRKQKKFESLRVLSFINLKISYDKGVL